MQYLPSPPYEVLRKKAKEFLHKPYVFIKIFLFRLIDRPNTA